MSVSSASSVNVASGRRCWDYCIITAKRSYESRVGQHAISAQTATLTENREQSEMHALTHARLLNQLQALPRSFSAETELAWVVFPAIFHHPHVSDQHQDDR
jgi:hypothetical protein